MPQAVRHTLLQLSAIGSHSFLFPSPPNPCAGLAKSETPATPRLFDWLRIPSISTDPKHGTDVRRAAEWSAAHLRESGLRVEIRETGTPGAGGQGSGHPIVMAFGGP